MSKVSVRKINMGDRAREDYGDLTSLSESLKKFGLLHPIIISDKNELIAGGRRLSAAMLLQWEEIEVKYYNDLTPLEQKEVELEENIARKDLTWDEEVALKKKITEIKRELAEEKGEDWTVEDTANVLGEEKRNTYRDIELANDLENHPELKDCKTKGEARTKARRIKNAKQREKMAALMPSVQLSTESFLGIHKGDCREVLKDIPSHSVDLIIADPPYGIQFDEKERNDSYIATYGDGLVDERQEVMSIVEPTMEECARILKPGGHIYLFFGIQHYFHFMSALEHTWMLKVQQTPLFWIKSSGENYKPYHRFTVNYEACLFAWKFKNVECTDKYKQKELNKAHMCTFENHPLSIGKKEHPAQKPLSLYKEIIELSSNEGDIILDPFLGSGISLVTALQLKRKVIGIESLTEWYNLALHNYNNYAKYEE